MQRIVVGVDGSEHSRHALDWAIAEARLREASVEVVNAWDVPFAVGFGFAPVSPSAYEGKAYEDAAVSLLDEMIAGAHHDDLEGRIEKIAVRGSAAWALLEVAKGAEMIVVGSRGRGGFTGLLLGSVSTQVAQHAQCPVVIVPPGQ
jgi:nucleotide-binding universal stress UspA family protein